MFSPPITLSKRAEGYSGNGARKVSTRFKLKSKPAVLFVVLSYQLCDIRFPMCRVHRATDLFSEHFEKSTC